MGGVEVHDIFEVVLEIGFDVLPRWTAGRYNLSSMGRDEHDSI